MKTFNVNVLTVTFDQLNASLLYIYEEFRCKSL